MERKFSIRTLQLVCLLSSLVIGGPIAVGEPQWLLLTLPVYVLFMLFGMSIGYHRGLAHGLLPESSRWTWVCLCLGTLSAHGRPMGWVLLHHLHHANSDQKGDPHAPTQKGFWAVALNYWPLPVVDDEFRACRRQVVRSILKRKSAAFFQRYYYRTILVFVLILFVAAGWKGVIFGYSMPVTLSILANSLVNAVCHGDGTPVDSWWLNVVTFGEGIHGAHHAQTGRVNLSDGSYLDISGLLMEKIVAKTSGHIGSHER